MVSDRYWAAVAGAGIWLCSCASHPPFALGQQARHCIDAATVGESRADALLDRARENLASAGRHSEREQREHFAHLALQQCRTARSWQAARQSADRIADLETARLHLQLGLRAQRRQAAEEERDSLQARLAIGHGRGADGSIAIPLRQDMFTPDGSALAAASGDLIAKVSGFLRRHRQWRAVVTSGDSTRARRRAAKVRHTLIARGIPPERVRVRIVPGPGDLMLLVQHPG